MLSQLAAGHCVSCHTSYAVLCLPVTSCAIPAADLPGHLCIHGGTVAQLPGPLPWHQLLFAAELAAGPQQPVALALPVE